MKLFIVREEWLASHENGFNQTEWWMKSIIGKKITKGYYHDNKLVCPMIDHNEIYDTLESAKTLSDYRYNREPEKDDNPRNWRWWDIYEIEIDSKDYVKKSVNYNRVFNQRCNYTAFTNLKIQNFIYDLFLINTTYFNLA